MRSPPRPASGCPFRSGPECPIKRHKIPIDAREIPPLSRHKEPADVSLNDIKKRGPSTSKTQDHESGTIARVRSYKTMKIAERKDQMQTRRSGGLVQNIISIAL